MMALVGNRLRERKHCQSLLYIHCISNASLEKCELFDLSYILPCLHCLMSHRINEVLLGKMIRRLSLTVCKIGPPC